jgi:hypothetical protein
LSQSNAFADSPVGISATITASFIVIAFVITVIDPSCWGLASATFTSTFAVIVVQAFVTPPFVIFAFVVRLSVPVVASFVAVGFRPFGPEEFVPWHHRSCLVEG